MSIKPDRARPVDRFHPIGSHIRKIFFGFSIEGALPGRGNWSRKSCCSNWSTLRCPGCTRQVFPFPSSATLSPCRLCLLYKEFSGRRSGSGEWRTSPGPVDMWIWSSSLQLPMSEWRQLAPMGPARSNLQWLDCHRMPPTWFSLLFAHWGRRKGSWNPSRQCRLLLQKIRRLCEEPDLRKICVEHIAPSIKIDSTSLPKLGGFFYCKTTTTSISKAPHLCTTQDPRTVNLEPYVQVTIVVHSRHALLTWQKSFGLHNEDQIPWRIIAGDRGPRRRFLAS